MSQFKLVTLVAFSLALTACDTDVNIENGMIPNELAPLAQRFVGDYHGHMERRATSLSARLEGNKLVLTSNDDLIASSCESRIGNLKKISYQEKDGNVLLTGAVFEFDPHLCANEVLGRTITLSFTSNDPIGFNVDMLDHYEHRQRCDVSGGHPGYPPHQVCQWETIAWYNTGRFISRRVRLGS